ncbi:MAG: hypothetical protein LBS84_07090 [Clostridiales bacterium]|jgi:hypothetical protein|nr:hypothetical protein [Clostridiales bacterium]
MFSYVFHNGYYVSSVGDINEDHIKRYIQEQQTDSYNEDNKRRQPLLEADSGRLEIPAFQAREYNRYSQIERSKNSAAHTRKACAALF